MVSLGELVPSTRVYRKFASIWDFEEIQKHLKDIESDNNYKGYGITRLFKCLLLQFLEDLSDRELERYLQENNAGKWFYGFELTEQTPDHTVFGRIRSRIGTNKLSRLFGNLRDQLKARGYMNEVFNFIDASQLIAKASLQQERDKAIKEKYEKLNNEVLPKVAHDKDARIGCKGEDKFWYGYKKHISVDMQSDLINKVAVTPANVPDVKGLKNVCPTQGAAYADKDYCTRKAKQDATRRGGYL